MVHCLRTPLGRGFPIWSDVQVIIRTTFPGQAPQIVENQGDLSACHHHAISAGAKTVRGYSMFGDSFVYILFRGRHRSVLGAARACWNT